MRHEILNSAALVIGVMLLAVGGPWLARELKTLPRSPELVARADQRVVALDVGGMTCAGCAARVHGELASVPGVAAADVRLQQERAYVVCEARVADSLLTAAIHRAGPGFIAAVAQR